MCKKVLKLSVIITSVTILFSSSSFGQTIIRHDNESVEMFAERLKPDSTGIAHKVIETNALDTTKKIIISFYGKTIYETIQMETYVDHSEYDIIIGFAYVPTNDSNYAKCLIDTIPPDGGNPEIISVFFANADKDKNKELIVLCKYGQRHYDYSGDIYETYIYKYSTSKNKFKYLDKLSKKFWGCECSSRDGGSETAKYQTAKDVRAKLKQLGFN
jgi:hypothetical protein